MRPLRRDTTDTEVRDHERRIEALERRFIETTGGGGEWCRVYFSDDYVSPESGRFHVEFDLALNHDPTIYSLTAVPGGPVNSAIQIEAEGVYAATWSFYVDVFTPKFPTNVGFYISTQHTTWTVEEEATYWGPLQAPGDTSFSNLASPILTGTKVFRAGADWNPTWMDITIGDDADDDLGIIGGDPNTSYLEIVRLVALTEIQDNPEDMV